MDLIGIGVILITSWVATSTRAGAATNNRAEAGGEPANLPSGWGARFSIQEENDAFGLTSPSDSFYTQGLRICARWVVEHDLTRLGAGQELFGVEFGHNIYTPSDIRLIDLETLRKDRPYAGWLYAGFLWELLLDYSPFTLRIGPGDATGSSFLGVEIAVGTTGPRAAGGPVQTNWHSLLRSLNGRDNPRAPLGWGLYETDNTWSLEISARYQFDALRARMRLAEITPWTGSTLAFIVSPRARLDLGGLFIGTAAGLEARTGLISEPASSSMTKAPIEVYIFARVDGRLIGYNGLIEAPLVNGVQTQARIAYLVAEVNVGLVVRIIAIEIAYAQLWRSDELRSRSSDAHNVGQIEASFRF